MKNYIENQIELLNHLNKRTDPEGLRIQKMLGMSDLTRRTDSPIRYVVDAILTAPSLKDCDIVDFPLIVPVKNNFDLLGTSPEHPSRRPSDTFYVDPQHVLRTQTTTMWTYYLRDPEILKKLKRTGRLSAFSCGAVYRRDEIDRFHYPVFHQADGLCITESLTKKFIIDDLVVILSEIARAIYGPDVQWRVKDDTFPFTTPSIQLEILWNEAWLEVLGAGLVQPKVLALLDLDPGQYNGWAFGYGLDRLAMIKMNIPDIRILWSEDSRIRRQFTGLNSVFHEVSKFPPVDRDISFVISKTVALNSFYEIVRECGRLQDEDLIEEVKLLDTYANEARFGADQVSYTFRIRYRSHIRTLLNDEINQIQETVRSKTTTELKALLR